MTLYQQPPNSILDGFEGPEKRLEIRFSVSKANPRGMRAINKDEWQEMCNLVKCLIISQTSNEWVDSYVLSESSLFVYSNLIMIKTCGTTTLLNCLDKLEEYANRCKCTITFVTFSRKNFNFPHKQPDCHSSFEKEVQLLSRKFKDNGSAHILGPVFGYGDHHFYYYADLRDPANHEEDFKSDVPLCPASPTLEILMSELDPMAMKAFYRNESFVDAKTTTKNVGLATVLPDMITDEVQFDPCGYSVNAISKRDGSYFTVHITPESHCSFVSFETNSRCNQMDVISDVLRMMKPGRFSILTAAPIQQLDTGIEGFVCRFKTHYEFNDDIESKLNPGLITMYNYSSKRTLASLAA